MKRGNPGSDAGQEARLTMILTSRRQQRVLAAIQGSLRKSDPRLVARFAAFTELSDGAAMPAAERVRNKPLRRLASALRGLARRRRRMSRRHRYARAERRDRMRWRLGGVVFIPAIAAAMVAVVILVALGQTQGSCGRSAPAPQTSAQQRPAPARGNGTGACPASPIPAYARGR